MHECKYHNRPHLHNSCMLIKRLATLINMHIYVCIKVDTCIYIKSDSIETKTIFIIGNKQTNIK
jgi:hypothetical protein